jgi:Acetyltransferase (GNAT) domain
MDNEASVKVLREIGELEEIRDAWESWPGNRDSEIESYSEFLQSNPKSVCPHVIVIYRWGRPDAILVGRIDIGHISCRLGYLRLNLPARILCFVYGALRGNPSRENCDLIVSSVLQSLSVGEADVAYMNFLREESELCSLAKKRPGVLSRDYLHVTQQHFAAALPASIDEFYRGLSPQARSGIRRKAKKLDEQFRGEVAIRCFREVSEIEELAVDAERLASKSYQRGLRVGFFDSPATRQHLRMKAERGWLRGYILYLRGVPCAFWIGDVNKDTFGSDYLAFDPAFGKHSPGMYLIMKVIEGFCGENREQVTSVDFAPGHAQYKEVLSTEEWLESSVYIFAPTFKGISFNLVRTLIGGTEQTVKKALVRTRLLQKVRKAWRAHATAKTIPEA